MRKIVGNYRWLLVLSLVVSVFSMVSCNGYKEDSDHLEDSIEIHPFNYKTLPTADGWNIGYLQLYFMNTSQSISKANFELELDNAIVDTEEGKDYPVDLMIFRAGGDIENYKGIAFSFDGGKSFAGWPERIILSPFVYGFPILPVKYDPQRGQGNYVISFRFANAATPKTMTLLTSAGDFTFDLRNIEEQIPNPRPIASIPFSGENNPFNQEEDDWITLKLDKNCSYDGTVHSMGFELINNDKFDEHNYENKTRFFVYHEGGRVDRWSLLHSIINEWVGPEQSIRGKFSLSLSRDKKPLYLIYIDNNNEEANVYKLDCNGRFP